MEEGRFYKQYNDYMNSLVEKTKQDYQRLIYESKHDTVVIGRRIREREKQRLEAGMCPICCSPIEYILTKGQVDILLTCGHEFVSNPYINELHKERCPEIVCKTKRSVSDQEITDIVRGNR
jgi:hypothetical protein